MNNLIQDDCLSALASIDDASIDAVITDPPYFLDKLDNKWDNKKVSDKSNQYVVKSLPAGMKFDPKQGKRFYKWYLNVSKELFRILKPGAFFFSFSSPRIYHRMTCAIEDAGFHIRDQFIWLYTQNQPKAMSLNHFINKLKIADEEKENLKKHLKGWKTPQVKSCHEPISMAQKPVEGTFLQNVIKYDVGLTDMSNRIGDNMFVANVMTSDDFDKEITKYFLVSKPSKSEKGSFNFHKTVKPVDVCKYLIGLVTRENQTILDPFCGSGTTCVAAKLLNRQYIGIDISKEYITIANERLSELQ